MSAARCLLSMSRSVSNGGLRSGTGKFGLMDIVAVFHVDNSIDTTDAMLRAAPDL